MKTITLSLIIGSAFAITIGCDKDETPGSAIVGEWRMTETHADNGQVIHDILGEEEIQTFSYHGTEYNATVTFTENPNEFIPAGYYKYEYTTTFLGNTETLILQSTPATGSGEWSINGDTMFQTVAGVTKEYIILELNDSKMRYRQDLNTTEGGLPTTATIFTSLEKN